MATTPPTIQRPWSSHTPVCWTPRGQQAASFGELMSSSRPSANWQVARQSSLFFLVTVNESPFDFCSHISRSNQSWELGLVWIDLQMKSLTGISSWILTYDQRPNHERGNCQKDDETCCRPHYFDGNEFRQGIQHYETYEMWWFFSNHLLNWISLVSTYFRFNMRTIASQTAQKVGRKFLYTWTWNNDIKLLANILISRFHFNNWVFMLFRYSDESRFQTKTWIALLSISHLIANSLHEKDD